MSATVHHLQTSSLTRTTRANPPRTYLISLRGMLRMLHSTKARRCCGGAQLGIPHNFPQVMNIVLVLLLCYHMFLLDRFSVIFTRRWITTGRNTVNIALKSTTSGEPILSSHLCGGRCSDSQISPGSRVVIQVMPK